MSSSLGSHTLCLTPVLDPALDIDKRTAAAILYRKRFSFPQPERRPGEQTGMYLDIAIGLIRSLIQHRRTVRASMRA